MNRINLAISIVIVTFCSFSFAESLVTASIGISFEDFIKQGGKFERSSEHYGDRYRVNIEKFENYSPVKVVVITVQQKKTLLRAVLANENGWYEFGIHPEMYDKEMLCVQIHCTNGIPYRNVWF